MSAPYAHRAKTCRNRNAAPAPSLSDAEVYRAIALRLDALISLDAAADSARDEYVSALESNPAQKEGKRAAKSLRECRLDLASIDGSESLASERTELVAELARFRSLV